MIRIKDAARVVAHLSVLFQLSVTTASSETTFTRLESLGYIFAVSGDGRVVVGEKDPGSGYEAFRTDSDGKLIGLGDMDGGIPHSTAFAANFNGSVIVGQSESASGFEAFRWTPGIGMVPLGDLDGGPFSSAALDVSDDGNVVVGSSDISGNSEFEQRWEAFRMTPSGMVGLGILPGGQYSEAWAVSGDGAVVVGESMKADGSCPFRWTAGGGMQCLGSPPGTDLDTSYGVASGVSNDGSVVVGSTGFDETEAFRWTSSSGMVGLGHLDGGNYGRAADVSADGSVVVGWDSPDEELTTAFIWDGKNGMRALKDVLENDYGLDLSGWHLSAAQSMSADGRTIVGFGTYNSGDYEGWKVSLGGPANTWVEGEGKVLSVLLANSGSSLLVFEGKRKRNGDIKRVSSVTLGLTGSGKWLQVFFNGRGLPLRMEDSEGYVFKFSKYRPQDGTVALTLIDPQGRKLIKRGTTALPDQFLATIALLPELKSQPRGTAPYDDAAAKFAAVAWRTAGLIIGVAATATGAPVVATAVAALGATVVWSDVFTREFTGVGVIGGILEETVGIPDSTVAQFEELLDLKTLLTNPSSAFDVLNHSFILAEKFNELDEGPFLCGGDVSIDRDSVCDGAADCADGSDEREEMCDDGPGGCRPDFEYCP